MDLCQVQVHIRIYTVRTSASSTGVSIIYGFLERKEALAI